jgi:hypothetical protein
VSQLRSYRLFGVSAFDFLGTVLIATSVANYYKWPLLETNAAFIGAGVVVHHSLGIETPLTKKVLGK